MTTKKILRDYFMENFELMKDAGFEIEKTNEKPNSFQVIVRYPDKDQTRRSFTFEKTPRWMDEKKYVEDGEIKSKKGWVLDIENTIEKELNSEKYDVQDSREFEGDTLDF